MYWQLLTLPLRWLRCRASAASSLAQACSGADAVLAADQASHDCGPPQAFSPMAKVRHCESLVQLASPIALRMRASKSCSVASLTAAAGLCEAWQAPKPGSASAMTNSKRPAGATAQRCVVLREALKLADAIERADAIESSDMTDSVRGGFVRASRSCANPMRRDARQRMTP